MNTADLDFIYDVECPVCGRKPTYQITEMNDSGQIINYTWSWCNHQQVIDLVEQRNQQVIDRYRQ